MHGRGAAVGQSNLDLEGIAAIDRRRPRGSGVELAGTTCRKPLRISSSPIGEMQSVAGAGIFVCWIAW